MTKPKPREWRGWAVINPGHFGYQDSVFTPFCLGYELPMIFLEDDYENMEKAERAAKKFIKWWEDPKDKIGLLTIPVTITEKVEPKKKNKR